MPGRDGGLAVHAVQARVLRVLWGAGPRGTFFQTDPGQDPLLFTACTKLLRCRARLESDEPAGRELALALLAQFASSLVAVAGASVDLPALLDAIRGCLVHWGGVVLFAAAGGRCWGDR